MFNGADFIGIDRDPRKIFLPKDGTPLEDIRKEAALKNKFSSVEEYELAVKYHKNRIFDPETYYYFAINEYPDKLLFNPNSLLLNDALNQFTNSLYLYSEMDKTRKKVEDLTKDEAKIKLTTDAKKRDELIHELTMKKKAFVKYLKKKKALEDNESIRNMVVPEANQSFFNTDESDPIFLLNDY
jgi:hypothetical protein